MSLKVWLPLNGDLENKGCSNVEVVNNGATLDNNGKIGKCYYFNGTNNYININGIDLDNQWSYGCWVYSDVSPRSWEGLIILNATGGDSDMQLGFYTYPGGNRFQSTANGQYNSNISLIYGQWNHLFATYDGTELKTYVNGNLINTKTITSALLKRNKLTIGARYRGSSYDTCFLGKINDVRIYDHVLSAAEVKEISQGLVVHYKLDSGYNENTINLAAGVVGYDYISKDVAQYATAIQGKTAYGNKIFTYSAYIKNTSDHPLAVRFNPYNAEDTSYSAFNGNYIQPGQEGRSIVTVDITDTSKWNGKVILYIQNGNAGTVPTNKTFYIKEVQVEEKNHATPFTPDTRTNTIIQDSSGYNNNGIINGELIISNDTTRYNQSILFNGVNSCITVPYNQICPENIFTINLWFKKDALGSKNYESLFGGPSGFEMDTRAGSSSSLSLYMASTRSGARNSITPLSLGQWYMISMVRDGTKERYYVNGIFQSEIDAKPMPTGTYWIGAWASTTGQNYYGYISDFRIYCTPLLDSDIKMLYNTSMSIDNLNNVHSFEFESSQNNEITKTGISKNDIIEPYITLKDGSYWKLLLFHYVDHGNNLFTSSNATYCNDFGLYSRLREINNYTYNGKYEYYVNQDGKEFRWTQTSSPTASSISGKTVVSGYLDPVNGLAKASQSNTYIGYNSWWGACGCWTPFTSGGKTGIPGFGSHDGNGICENYLALYTRIEKDKVFLEKSFINASNFIEK